MAVNKHFHTSGVSAVATEQSLYADLVAEAIQIHGGIGMTDEYEIGFFIKRARPAQMLLGGYNYHANRFALISGY